MRSAPFYLLVDIRYVFFFCCNSRAAMEFMTLNTRSSNISMLDPYSLLWNFWIKHRIKNANEDYNNWRHRWRYNKFLLYFLPGIAATENLMMRLYISSLEASDWQLCQTYICHFRIIYVRKAIAFPCFIDEHLPPRKDHNKPHCMRTRVLVLEY